MPKLRIVEGVDGGPSHRWTESAPNCLLVVVRGADAHLETTCGRYFEVEYDSALDFVDTSDWEDVPDGIGIMTISVRDIPDPAKPTMEPGAWEWDGVRGLNDAEWARFCAHQSVWPVSWLEPGVPIEEPVVELNSAIKPAQWWRLLEVAQYWVTWRRQIGLVLTLNESALAAVVTELGGEPDDDLAG